MGELREHQIPLAAALTRILDRYRSAADKSSTGTGKTYVASKVAADAHLPTLVIHPKVAYSTWERGGEAFGEKFSQVGYELLRAGGTPFGHWSGGAGRRVVYYKCQCCQRVVDLENIEPCYVHAAGIHCIERRTKAHDYGHFVFAPEVKQVIFDEAHRCGGIDSLNSEMLIAAKRQGLRTLVLSATLASSPLQMRALGYLLDLHNLNHDFLVAGEKREMRPAFYRWLSHLGCRQDPKFRGWKWFVSEQEQREQMARLHDLIIPGRGVRIRCEDIPGFPACDIQPELYDVSDPARLDALYQQVKESVELLRLRKEGDVDPDHPLTRILRARQEIELIKVPIAEELGQDSLDKGFSVVFFVNFRQTIDELAKRFPGALIIDGSPDSVKRRGESLARFQANECRTLIVNNEAGGVVLSMQDLDGEHPRIGYVMPSPSAVTMRQVFGRLPRDGGKSMAHYRVLLAAKTIETHVHRALRARLNNMDALNDADLNPSNLMIKVS
jgi:hypothetical protein